MNKEALANYLLWIGDNNLIMGQRLSEWCGHGPFLEQDIALTNLALDHIGQTQLIFDYAAELRGKNETHDDLAFMRDEIHFKNSILVELPNGDFAETIAKIFFFSAFQEVLYKELANSTDERVSQIAKKSIKEVRYHFEHSSNWVLRLGDGTEESHKRMQNAIDKLWNYGYSLVKEVVETDTIVEKDKTGISPSNLEDQWLKAVSPIIKEATLEQPNEFWIQHGGKNGKHSEHLGHLLSEMQYLQRAYPGNEW